MAVDVHPEGRDSVQVTATFYVKNISPFRPFDDQRLLGQILPHLGERLPAVAVIERGQTGYGISHFVRLRENIPLRSTAATIKIAGKMANAEMTGHQGASTEV
jgi:hypothetical protein